MPSAHQRIDPGLMAKVHICLAYRRERRHRKNGKRLITADVLNDDFLALEPGEIPEEVHMPSIAVNDIVQITQPQHPWFPCLLIVTEVKSWGVQAFAFVPKSNDGSTPPGQAFNRLTWEQVEQVGTAVMIPKPDADEEPPDA